MAALTEHVVLKHGIKIGETHYKELVLREPCLGDMMMAEQEYPTWNGLAFRVALVRQCIERVVDLDNIPVTTSMLKEMKPSDWNTLSVALNKLEGAEGNG